MPSPRASQSILNRGKGPLPPLLGIDGRSERLLMNDNLSIWRADGHRHLLTAAHHDTFYDCLSAIIEFGQSHILMSGPHIAVRTTHVCGASLALHSNPRGDQCQSRGDLCVDGAELTPTTSDIISRRSAYTCDRASILEQVDRVC